MKLKTFKAYIDNIVRINRTFTFNHQNHTFQGLVTGKKALIITPSIDRKINRIFAIVNPDKLKAI